MAAFFDALLIFPPEEISHKRVDTDGKGGHAAVLLNLGNDGVKMIEDLRHAHGVDLARGVVALFDELLEVAAGNLHGELVGDNFARALLLLHPCGAGQRDPHWPLVHIEAHIHSIGVARGDGDNVGLPAAMQVFAAPAISDVEFLVHASRLSPQPQKGKRLDCSGFDADQS